MNPGQLHFQKNLSNVCMVENKIEIMPVLYNAAPIPGHLLTERNLATIPVQCCCHSWTLTTKQTFD